MLIRWTPLYAGALAVVFVWLALSVIKLRKELNVGLGDGGNRRLAGTIRAHANFAEYVPISLLLLAFLEASGLPGWVVNGLGLTLIGARLLHARGMIQPQALWARRVGTALTLLFLLASAALALYQFGGHLTRLV
jgi:uncharacterized membrane protein YecN with MAPEG domain